MTAVQPVHVHVHRHFCHPAEHVFDAWLDSVTAGGWLFATPKGKMVRVEIEPRVGGGYVLVDRREGEDVEHTGKYLMIERPSRLVFTLTVPKYSKDVDRVIVDFVSNGEECTLTLTHEMQPHYAEYVDRAEQGWVGILDGLAATLARSQSR